MTENNLVEMCILDVLDMTLNYPLGLHTTRHLLDASELSTCIENGIHPHSISKIRQMVKSPLVADPSGSRLGNFWKVVILLIYSIIDHIIYKENILI